MVDGEDLVVEYLNFVLFKILHENFKSLQFFIGAYLASPLLITEVSMPHHQI